jgi:hypothetical protein
MTGYWRKALALSFLIAVAPAAAQPIADAGPVTVQAVDAEADENLQWAASVVVVNDLAHQGDLGGKLFGAAGGDPAMNGLNTFLAFFTTQDVGWRIFQIGDFLSYRIVRETPGRILLEVSESIMNANGDISARTRRLAVTWTAGPDGTAPTNVRVATAP